MVAPASERSVPCGVCQIQVPESHFRSGRARLYQEVLYCITCTSEAEKARVETAAFKQSLTKGFYACSKCESPMAMKDIETNNVIFFGGNLYCRDCSKDLRSILHPGGRPPSLRGSAVFNSQSSGVGLNHQSGVTQTPSRRFSASQLGKISGTGSAMGATSSGMGAVSGMAASPGGSTSSGMGTVSGRQAPAGPPCHLCDKPAVAVAGKPLPLEYQGNTYCGSCRSEVDAMIARSKEDLARISTFECQRCHASVRARDVIEGRAIRYRGQILCAGCSKDVGGRSSSSLEVPSVGPAPGAQGAPAPPKKQAPVATPQFTAPCARCERTIPGLDIRLGKCLERDGKLFCAKCRVDLEQARELRERKAAKAVTCSHCGRAISQKEIQEKKITYHEGNVFCSGCGKDPAKILLGHSSDELAVGKCRMCGTPIAPGTRGQCPSCQARVQKLQEESLAKSSELLGTSALSYPCDGQGCGNSITEEDLEGGRAIIVGDKSLCPACAAKAKPKKAGARCPRCRKALDPGVAPGSFCSACAEKSADDAADMEAALKLSSEFTLRCGTCQRAVHADELESGKAITVHGKLVCGTCRNKQAPAKQATPSQVLKKLCATCDGTLQGAGVPYGDKRICTTCQGLLETILAGAQMPATQVSPCKACKKQAKGEGALLIDGQPFCKACRRAADFLILYNIRAKRTSARRGGGGGSKLPLLVAAGSALAIFAIAWGIFTNRDSGPQIKVGVEPPKTTKKNPEDDPVNFPPGARASQIIRNSPRNFKEAQDIVEKLQKIQQESNDTKNDAKIGECVTRALAQRNAFAKEIAAPLLAAAEALARQGKLDDAIRKLDELPQDVRETEAGREVAKVRERLSALLTCNQQASRLIANPAPEVYLEMERLLSSPGAAACNFGETPLGKRLEEEKRIRRLEVVSKNNGVATQPETGRLSAADALARAKDQEQKHSYANAENFYNQVLDAESDNVEALIGLARLALEADRPRRALKHVDRLRRMAAKRPETKVLDGWLALVDLEPNNHDRAKAALSSVATKDLGARGKALQAIVDLGPSTPNGQNLLVVGAEPESGIFALAAETAERASTIFGVPRGDDRMLVLMFKSNEARSSFVSKLGRPLNDDGRLPGCFSVALANPSRLAVATAVTTASAARADGCPAWIIAALPLVACKEAPPAPTGDSKEATLAELEGASLSAMQGNPGLIYGAYKRVASALEAGKASVLATYVATRRSGDAKKASRELEAALSALPR